MIDNRTEPRFKPKGATTPKFPRQRKRGLTVDEIRAAFKHAKEHIVEAIEDAIGDEHHKFMEVDGVQRRDIQSETERFMEGFLKIVRRTSYGELL